MDYKAALKEMEKLRAKCPFRRAQMTEEQWNLLLAGRNRVPTLTFTRLAELWNKVDGWPKVSSRVLQDVYYAGKP